MAKDTLPAALCSLEIAPSRLFTRVRVAIECISAGCMHNALFTRELRRPKSKIITAQDEMSSSRLTVGRAWKSGSLSCLFIRQQRRARRS